MTETVGTQEWRGATVEGVKRMMREMLVTAIGEASGTGYCQWGRSRSGMRDEAVQWIMDDEEEYVFAFVPVCEAVGVDAQAVRELVQRRMEEQWEGAKRRTDVRSR